MLDVWGDNGLHLVSKHLLVNEFAGSATWEWSGLTCRDNTCKGWEILLGIRVKTEKDIYYEIVFATLRVKRILCSFAMPLRVCYGQKDIFGLLVLLLVQGHLGEGDRAPLFSVRHLQKGERVCKVRL